ncbi:hypothetical protein EV192_108293 [Actinocrispum wychmicini]|uniref:CDP-glycerol:poly(Glycerophosphate) glycerophosphotransferase n=1 Tax=Actinocrispum wychmicini TaxID=1213861 RepID=A0A4R2JLE1_9PSEU|nr:hypothetical protein EV192_108293 [Actinocrispum wychmicini]
MPVGVRAHQWMTVPAAKRVLVIAHNLTTVTRLMDVLSVFDSDFRVQVVVSWSGTDPFTLGLDDFMRRLGVVTIPWEQALRTEFDLAIAASHHGGGLTEINAPVAIMSHGIGYTKYSPGNRKSEIGNRKSVNGQRQTFGLSPQWLLYDGQPIAEALVFSHPEQVARLERDVPEAAHTAVIAGDPCYDRMLASLGLRRHYRRLLGADDRKVVTVSSTWSDGSLLGSWPELLRSLLAELPIDEYQVVAFAHPNAWAAHGPWQIRTWLADCLRAGLVLVPPAEGWRAALIAADVVVGDHGATTTYAAAIGRPVLLAAFPDDDVVAESAVGLLGRLAGRLDRRRPLRAQLDRAVSVPEVRDLVTAVPGESTRLLRALFYRLMGLSEPPTEPVTARISDSGLTARPAPTAVSAHVTLDIPNGQATMVRYPAEIQPAAGTHLMVHIGHPQRTLRANADILGTDHEDPTDLLAAHPGCAMVATPDGTLTTRDGRHIDVGNPDYAPVIQAWLDSGEPLPTTITVNGTPVHPSSSASGNSPSSR